MYGLSTSVISQRIEGPPPSFSTIFGTTPDKVNQEDIRDIKNILGPLLEYDKSKGSNLMETLVEYFRCGNNIKQMAKKLYIHYNTAIYRIELIQKLLNVDLNNPDDRFNIQLALKLTSLDRAGLSRREDTL
ncbi:helix-turn-helix domain-containing protein [Thermanaeromonas sp. C210]|uniref:PucR family transcriptional regulator n=1 Tax=Thermanaeromonas sp. C210 TaxID=2731925 RepID=UPI00155CB00B|nr:helix-turn-helix domain-containing protein [Thermanaeromonas sp. C210]GFN23690.1 hypothetical protein TAMC210_20070 [Thermanaeromonas sp. C210]